MLSVRASTGRSPKSFGREVLGAFRQQIVDRSLDNLYDYRLSKPSRRRGCVPCVYSLFSKLPLYGDLFTVVATIRMTESCTYPIETARNCEKLTHRRFHVARGFSLTLTRASAV